jgi:uncharacterized protein
VLGVLHAVFAFVGDILLTYAILGLVLLAVRRRPTRWLLRAAAVAAIVGAMIVLAAAAAIATGPALPEGDAARALDAYVNGSFWEVAAQRVHEAGSAVLGPDRSSGPEAVAGLVLQSLSAPLVVAGFVAAMMRASLSPRFRPVERAVTPGGRSSLSVYLGESIVASLVLCGYGLGLFGQVGPALGLLLALVIWAVLEVAAGLWLRRARHVRYAPTAA